MKVSSKTMKRMTEVVISSSANSNFFPLPYTAKAIEIMLAITKNIANILSSFKKMRRLLS